MRAETARCLRERVQVKVCVPQTLGEPMRALLAEYVAELGLSLFSELCRKDLRSLLGSRVAVEQIEATCSMCDFANLRAHADLNKRARRRNHKQGMRFRRGKRTRPEMSAFIEGLVPIIAGHGVPVATGDDSLMVRILRRVAAEIWPNGKHDPRGELRRRARIQRQNDDDLRRQIFGAIAQALRPVAKNELTEFTKSPNICP